MKQQIGTIRLKSQYRFTQYSECAAWTDYVTAEPQTVPLYYDGYWVFARFAGTLTETTFPKDGYRTIGQPWQAGTQTQAFGGIGNWMDGDLFQVELSPEWNLAKHGVYGEGCGESTGKPIVALEKRESLSTASAVR